jgi:asparagine synthase (glutamine-hydrolysing)
VDSVAEDTARTWIHEMTAALVHRGPDGAGAFFDRVAGIGFGHRRLSIVDLTDAGQQPMWSKSGRYCITYNGEVYNAPEIRADLDQQGVGIAWKGHSDTEVVLEAIEALGLGNALRRFRGMFAFALWDRETKSLFLVRDRLGIKPLLYTQGSFGIAFSSELQALYELPLFQARLDRSAMAAFLRYGVVPGDECIVERVHKVPPGTIIRFNGPGCEGTPNVFWSAAQIAAEGMGHPIQSNEQETIEELERRIRESVMLRMRSDVPFGAFLSGGIDSSTVVAMMQQCASAPIKTFCIGNTLSGYDEATHAEAVARHLGCDHHTLIAEPSDMLAVVPEMAHHWDEPFADSSQIPTLLVSQLTREHVTVALSGDGGDELFAGYNRHAWAPRLWDVASRLPQGARKAFGALKLVPVDDWDRAFRAVGLGNAIRLPGDKLHKVASLAEVSTPDEFYGRLRSHWVDPENVMADHFGPRPPATAHRLDGPFTAQMMLQDLVEYLPDDILTKVDRASMAVSLEARVPLLDHDVVEFAWRLPLGWKIRGRTQKWILKQVLARHVPAALFERPKMGFGVPVGQWIRGPLKDWAADLLDESALRADGVFDADVVRSTWAAHQAGRGNHEHQLWAVLMFQSWWRLNRRNIES